MSDFSQNVLTHVLTHEVGHALIREFDLPILSNEEIAADQFATYYLHNMMPDRVGDIVRARLQSWMIESDDETIFSEYADDVRRAGYTLCFLYGLDPERHSELAQEFGMTGEEAGRCRDFAPEIARSWRRVLDPLAMPQDARVTEVRVIYGDGPWKERMEQSATMRVMETVLNSFDWHSLVTLHVDHCEGGASWRRNGRRILLCDQLIERFEDQAKTVQVGVGD